MRPVIALLSFLLVIPGCKESNKMFVEKYDDEDFEKYINTTIFFRSGDNDGGIILFAYDGRDKNNGAYIITIDKSNKIIKKTDTKLIKNSTLVDTARLKELSLDFLKYPINLLSVDSNYNVLINLKNNERPNLIRFSDIKFKNGKYKSWKHIKDNWYETHY